MSKPLSGQVALVAGATRGAGRGIARELAAAGARVYCSGRSTRRHAATPGRPETIDETAELIAADGGSAVAVRTDHADEAQVAALAERLKRDEGRLDILVNDIWGGDELIGWGQKFWQIDMTVARKLVDQAVFTHLITARHLTPLMVEAKRGLIVEVTDGEFPGYRGQLLYDFIKSSLIRLAYAMAWDLKDTGVTALAISPGFLRSEAMLERFGVTEVNWRDGIARDAQFAHSETPRYVGRAIAALAADPNVGERSGSSIWAADLADIYGFTDVDGTRPNFWRNVEAWLDGEISKGTPLSGETRWILAARYAHIHTDPARAERAKRYAAALGALT
ncbi:MAG: SDR family NAD(P)-dependent oxidoreductase [Proteobacteria bacterium]|nr:SDR family NAD(P)-dependent oxidoreductase [Pseudomonadota bacterium]